MAGRCEWIDRTHVESVWNATLETKHDKQLPSFAFKIKLLRYSMAVTMEDYTFNDQVRRCRLNR